MPYPTFPWGRRARAVGHLPRGVDRRVQRRGMSRALLDKAVGSINGLAVARPGMPLCTAVVPNETDVRRCSPSQRDSLFQLAARIDRVVPPPMDLRPEETLQQLLKAHDLYHIERSSTIGSYDLDRIRVCRGDLRPKELEDVLPPSLRHYALAPDRWIVKSDAELAADTDSGLLPSRPYWDPILRASRARCAEFLRALASAGLLT